MTLWKSGSNDMQLATVLYEQNYSVMKFSVLRKQITKICMKRYLEVGGPA